MKLLCFCAQSKFRCLNLQELAPFIGCAFVLSKNEKLNQLVAAINGNSSHRLVTFSRIRPFVPKVLKTQKP